MKTEVLPAFKKAAIPSVLTFRTAQFGAAFRYLIVTPISSFATYDGEGPFVQALGREGASRLLGKLRKCVNSVSSSAAINRADLGYGPDDLSPEGLWVLSEADVLPGKRSELESHLKDTLVPFLKSAGVPAFLVSQLVLGEGSAMTFAVPIPNNAALDLIFGGAPPAELSEIESLLDQGRSSLVAFASELSYLPQ